MEALLDFTRPVSVPLMDNIVRVYNDASHPQVRACACTCCRMRGLGMRASPAGGRALLHLTHPPSVCHTRDRGTRLTRMHACVCANVFRPRDVQRAAAESVLVAFRQHPESWTRVDTILSESTMQQTKFLALQILEDVIKFRWTALPKEQREGIRSYLVQKVIMVCLRGRGGRDV
ncbi:hypothetical protein EON66_05990 [archaeon]|nr:MAG: hypothetical protein EON66_05990 [archaeon]